LRGSSAYGGGEAASALARNGSSTGSLSSSAGIIGLPADFGRERRRRLQQSARTASRTAIAPPATAPAMAPTLSLFGAGVGVGLTEGVEDAVEVVESEDDGEENGSGEDVEGVAEAEAVLGQFVRFLPASPRKSLCISSRKTVKNLRKRA
jgi:hypothetical protein